MAMDPRIKAYFAKKGLLPEGYDDAESDVSGLDRTKQGVGFAKLAGQLADNSANSSNSAILDNRFEDLGKAPTLQEAPHQKTDFSVADSMINNRSDAARQRLEQMKSDMRAQMQSQQADDKAAAEQAKYDTTRLDREQDFSLRSGQAAETVRANRVREQAARAKTAGTGNTNDPLAKIPVQLRDNHLSQKNKQEQFDLNSKVLEGLIDEASSTTLYEGMAPQIMGGKDYDATKAKIAAAIMGVVPGIRSDADFKNLIEPMIPKPGDIPETSKKKAADLKAWLVANRPKTTVGDTYGQGSGKPASGSDYDSMSYEELTRRINEGK